MSRFRRALMLFPLLTCACQASYRIPLVMEVSRDLPEHCWVVLKGGERIPLDEGRVTADSIMGTRRAAGRVTVARERVAYVEVRQRDVGSTLALVSGVLLIPIGVFFAAVAVGVARTL